MTTLPASTAPPGLPAMLDGATRDRLEAALAASRSPATRRAYRTAWGAWRSWALAHGTPIPAAPEAVAAYLAHRAGNAAGMATLRMASAAISAAHELAGLPSPCRDRIVRTALRGFGRQAAAGGAVTRQARGLTAEAVAAIRGAFGDPGRTSARRARDLALVSVMSEAGLRRSEAAALRWADVTPEADGSGRLTVRRSKTDPAAAGAVVALTARAMADLDQFAAQQGARDPAAPVFGLSDRQIARRIAAAAKAAGLGDGFSGHSGRVGMAQRMTRQGRWATVRMVARYL